MDQQSDRLGRPGNWINLVLVVLLILAILGIILISAGATDPKPLGRNMAVYKLAPAEIASNEPHISWLQLPTISERFTIRLKAALREGSPDTGYGLVLGSDSDSVVIAVSPTGYLTILRWPSVGKPGPDTLPILPWQVWPHVGRNHEQNEIWVDVEAGYITSIRINRELLWEKAIPVKGSDIGLFTQGFDGSATIDFQTLEYFSGM